MSVAPEPVFGDLLLDFHIMALPERAAHAHTLPDVDFRPYRLLTPTP